MFDLIAAHLETGGYECAVYSETTKVQVDATKIYYADIVVSCNDVQDPLKEPECVVEVLSRATERIDRVEKLLAYKQTLNLWEYVLIAENRFFVQIHWWHGIERKWTIENYFEPDDDITLKTINLTVRLSEIYRDITFLSTETSDELR